MKKKKGIRGRPKLDCLVKQVRITLSLRSGEDDDLLTFFTGLPNGRRAAALKIALRAGGVSLLETPPNSDNDLEQTIQDLVFG